jgi:transposase-like protein
MRAVARQALERWAAIVAEAETPGVHHADIAVKHRVSLSALKYHVYKARRGVRTAAPRLLPVRIEAEPVMLQVQVGAVRVSFPEGCSPSYVAALLTALAKATC